MEEIFVGMDVHSKESVYVIQDAAGKVLGQGSAPTTAAGLQQWRERHELPAATPVALETGTVAFFVARQLAQLGLRAMVVDAHEVRLKAHRPRQKSDRRDAFELCDGLRRGIYRVVVHVPPLQISRLRETLSRRRHFVRVRTAEVNAAKRLLRAQGLGHLSRSLRTDTGWDKVVAAVGTESDLHLYLQQHRTVWRCAGEQIRALDARLEELGRPYQRQIEQLQTIPGVGFIVAATAIATFSDVGRFPSAKKAASYSGLVPSTYQSGSREAHGRITKQGCSELRAMLCEAAHHAARPTHPLHPYFSALCAKRGYKMAVVAVAHRLGRIMFAMLRDGAEFDWRKLPLELGPFEQTRTKLFRLTLQPVKTSCKRSAA